MTAAKVPVGAVMVVGAGIGGMQASIDLANSGFQVYLVERDTAIGGRMAMLDKTFPTNDCAMCIISPKLIEVGRHPNIEVLTNTELMDLQGDPGHFKAKVMRHPRFVELDKCTGCGECAKVCPIELPNEYNMGMDGRRAIRKRYPQAIPGGYAIEKAGTSPCRDACPTHARVQGYTALIAQGRFDEALKVIRRDLPFPAVCGRVCPHPCEDACNRAEVDESVSIRALKRFVIDHEMAAGEAALPEVAEDTGKSVAVIGGGPSGLSAAWFLRLKGHKAVVYESAPKAGGMLRYGIPDYRLPQDILDKEIETFEKLGVEIRCNTKVGEDVDLSSLKNEYDAMYIALGAQSGRGINIPGEDAPGVLSGIDFLRESAMGRIPQLGKKVVVIGGGDVAYDAARTSIRSIGQGDDKAVYLCCLESFEEMMASDDEIVGGEEEGLIRKNSSGPVEIIKDDSGKVCGIVMRKCTRVFDELGKFSPEFDDNERETIDCDNVIITIGQGIDAAFLEGTDLAGILEYGRIKSNPLTLETPVAGIFSGGDNCGPTIAIQAIAHGKEAAVSIDRYFNGLDIAENREWAPPLAKLPKKIKNRDQGRMKEEELEVGKRIGGFDEINKPITAEQAMSEAERCLACGICSECGLCEEACQAKAVDHGMKDYEQVVDVGSVILSPGFDQFEAEKVEEYGYGRWSNVVTSLDFERLLSATGPTTGHIKRPSDHRDPKKVAWIQCVGSRDKRNDRNYCSAVCCMFATKEAVIATDHAGGDLDTTIFMMDLRAAGKGFDEYCNRATDRYGVKYVRSMISRVDEVPGSKDIEVTYLNEAGEPVKEIFDMLVLSTGLRPSDGVKSLAASIGVELNDYGFTKSNPFAPMATSKPGVFVCGVMQGPKDIPETVAQASGAAAFAMRGLASARGTCIKKEDRPVEIDKESEEQRIGVWVCNCGINIGSVVDVPDVADHAGGNKGVVHSEGVLFACSQDNQEHMKKVIKEKGINRMVVASCTPRTHEPLFQETLRDTGINNYLFSMANIREHCSWVHQQEPEKATEKAKMMVDMAISNAKYLKPLHKQEQSLFHGGLVLGGGLAGMTAALELADQGFDVTLIEKSDRLGGNLLKVRATHDGRDIKAFRDEMIHRIENHEHIDLKLNTRMVSTGGFLGNFESTLETGNNGDRERITVQHGATIVAIGGHESTPEEFAFGQSDAVITQLDLESRLMDESATFQDIKEVVMIQCVGSRNDERPYCSKLCCSESLKNALEIKKRSPETNVTILYREMRSYGLREDLFTEARKAGVMFLRYSKDDPPIVTPQDSGCLVEADAGTLGKVEINADIVALAAAIVPNENKDVAQLLKLPKTADGFFLEVHSKLAPIDFASDGIFMAGLAHGPKPIDESIAQAAAAAAKASAILSQEYMTVGGQISVVDPDLCAVCLNCVRACPYGVPRIDSETGAAYIEPAECRGCGVCASECPGKAIQLQHFTNDQIGAMLRVLTEGAQIG